MTYRTGSIVSNANPRAALLTEIETALTDHPGWDFVEEVTISTTTSRVWKNLGTQNSHGQDFYLVISWSTSGTPATNSLILQGCEAWNATTKRMQRPTLSTGTFTPNADGLSAPSATDFTPASGGVNVNVKLESSVTNTTYWILVTKDAIYAQSSVNASAMAMVGLFTPIWVHANEFPLIAQNWASSINSAGGFSRRPAAAQVSTANAFRLDVSQTQIMDVTLGTVGAAAPSPLYTNVAGARIRVISNSATSSSEVRGYTNGAEILYFSKDTAVVKGDTITIDGQTWVCIFDPAASQGVFVNTQAA